MNSNKNLSQSEIQQLAYFLWEKAGRPDGLHEHFWTLSEKQLAPNPLAVSLQEQMFNYSPGSIRYLTKGLLPDCTYYMYRIQEEVPELQLIPPQQETLWHYTTANALLKIIENGEFWSTQVACLNDGHELRHALRLTREVLDLRDVSTNGDHEKRFRDFMMDRLNSTPSFYHEIYIASFSEKEDDLSQWRAYGGSSGENGYSIGFDSERLASLQMDGHTAERNPVLRRVVYAEDRQRYICRRMIDALFEVLRKSIHHWEKMPSNISDVSFEFLARCFDQHAGLWFPLMKHNSFHDENEWRLVYRVESAESSKLRFIPRSSMISRHFPLQKFAKDKLLPIREVCVGPSRHQAVSKDSIRSFLRIMGYDQSPFAPRVTLSTTPFQTT